jgi:hypothetical protein
MERTIFVVQPYVRAPSGVAKGHVRRLLSRDAAIRAARAYRGAALGVAVYSVTGNPDADFWREPVLIARSGQVPAEAEGAGSH